MKIFHGLRGIPKFKNPVVVLGVFDGVHLGHRHILKAAVNLAHRKACKSIAVTFYPHPQKQESLHSLSHRLRLIAFMGLDICIVINFSPDFAKIGAEDFVKKILSQKLNASYVLVGNNFRFGKSAEGDLGLLKRMSKQLGFKLRNFAVKKIGSQQISSTYIRRLITSGRLIEAQALLLDPVTVLGTVIKGMSLASKLGYPTANINPHHEILPPSGVYAVKVVFNKKIFKGVCNIGKKPTILKKYASLVDKHVEVYIFDFNKDIYGEDLQIRFISKIRNEKKFSSLNELYAQIKKDVLKAKKILSKH